MHPGFYLDRKQRRGGNALMKNSATAAALFAALACLSVGPRAAEAQSVVTYHNAPDRSGDFKVPGLTLAAAAKLHLDTAFNATISGNVYAQPLYWEQRAGKPPLLIVATESNTVYALNANTGATVWKTQLAHSVARGMLPCGDIDPEGVTGTPVIDPATGRLYLDATTLQGGGSLPRHMIYALSLVNGRLVAHWPINVDDAMAARHASFTSELQGERSALQFFKGKLYVAYGGRGGDCVFTGTSYHGVVVEITPSAVPAISGDWETRAARGGIWSQGGVTSDGTSLFVTTGNTSGVHIWGDGEAIVRLAPGLAHSLKGADYFAPSNWLALDNGDNDLGGTAAVPITVPASPQPLPRILGFGKDGHAYLVNVSNMGGIGHALENMKVANNVIITAPAIFGTPRATLAVFASNNGLRENCSGQSLSVLRVTSDATTPITLVYCVPIGGAGAPIITTTNGFADPIIWAYGAEADNQMHGFDLLTGQTVFAGAGTGMTGLHRFGTLIGANHHLYVAADNKVYAFTF
jgi:hypothetical protein